MMPELTFEQIREASEEEIIALYRAGGWWEESPEARATIPGMLKGSFCVIGAREPDGRLVGMGRALSDGCSDAYIQDVVVLNEYRGKGVGSRIIQRLARHCQEHGISWIGLIGEPGTQDFYERLGFRPMKDYIPMRLETPPERH